MTSRLDAATYWRAICPNFEQDGHTKHTRSKDTLKEAEAVAAANDRLYEQLAKDDSGLVSYFQSEIGWRVETRIMSDWEVVA